LLRLARFQNGKSCQVFALDLVGDDQVESAVSKANETPPRRA
jgi:hypothetical protein